MCFYFLFFYFFIFLGKTNKCVGGKPASTYDYFSFWGRSFLKNPNLWATKNEKLLSLTNLWFRYTTLGFARWKSLIHSSVFLPPTPELILTSPTRLLTRLTEHAPPLLVVHTLLVWLDVVKIVLEIDPPHCMIGWQHLGLPLFSLSFTTRYIKSCNKKFIENCGPNIFPIYIIENE